MSLRSHGFKSQSPKTFGIVFDAGVADPDLLSGSDAREDRSSVFVPHKSGGAMVPGAVEDSERQPVHAVTLDADLVCGSSHLAAVKTIDKRRASVAAGAAAREHK